MDKFINIANRARLTEIRNELFDMANSYAGDIHGHIACRLHGISNSVYNIRDIMEVLYSHEDIPAEDQHGRELGPWQNVGDENANDMHAVHIDNMKPDKVKPLAQYLGEYLTQDMFVYTKYDEQHIGIRPDCLSRIVKEALDAYESTEQVKIRIEPV